MDRLRAIIATLVILSAPGWAGTMSAAASGAAPSAPTLQGPAVTPQRPVVLTSADQTAGPAQGSGAGKPLQANVTRSMVGVNVATWDGQLPDPSTIPALQDLGVGMQQFPNLDAWNWQTNESRNAQNGYRSWNKWTEPVSLDKWGQILQASDTSGLYIVPYGENPTWTGDESVANVRQLTQYIVDHHIPVRAMVIGSEAYGNWSINLGGNRSPQQYAQTAIAMIQAIHAVAPQMLVGVDVVEPANPLGPMPQDLAWNKAVISACAPYIQFISAHSYPVEQIESNTSMLQTVSTRIDESMAFLRGQLNEYAGGNASRIQVWITEFNIYNGVSAQSQQPVFEAAAAEALLTWLADGAQEVDWWSLHGDASTPLPLGASMSASSLVTTQGTPFGTFGLASEALGPQPAPVNTLYPAGEGLAEVMRAIGQGAHVTVWPGLRSADGVFAAEVDGAGGRLLFAVNLTTTTKTLSLGSLRVDLTPAALVVRDVAASSSF